MTQVNTRIPSLRFVSCTVREYPGLLAFLDRAFQKKERYWFQNRLGHIFNENPDSCKNHFRVFRQNEWVGVIGLYPFRLRVGKAVLRCGGVGSVAPRMDCRGQGILSAMLVWIKERLRREHFDISWLHGDRLRYRRYGWDFGGQEVRYTLTAREYTRSVNQVPVIRTFPAGMPDIPRLQKAYRGLYSRVQRSAADWKRHLERPHCAWHCATSRFGFAALGVFRDSPECVQEIYGEVRTLDALLHSYLARCRSAALIVRYPNVNDAVTGLLHESCATWHSDHHGQIQVISPVQCWEKLVPELCRVHRGEGMDLARELDSVVDDHSRLAVLQRILGSRVHVPRLPKTCTHLEKLHPLGWWMSAFDGV